MTSLSRTWQWWAATASAVCVARLGAVANWRCSWPIANMRACQWRTFWTYLVTVNLFSLYLMNFMFHTTLDAVGNILRVHYKSMKCDVSFSQGSVSTLFRSGEHVFHVYVKCSSCLQHCKNYKSKRVFAELWSQMYCHVFMNHGVNKVLPPKIINKIINPLHNCTKWAKIYSQLINSTLLITENTNHV